jgi:hypothetical protein
MTIETLEVTPPGTEKKSYLRTGRFANAMQSIWVRVAHHDLSLGNLRCRKLTLIGIECPEEPCTLR